MELKSLSAPAIGERGVQRLFNFCTPKRLDNTCTLFDAGYEQAKRDMHEKIVAEIGRPTDDIQSPESAADQNRVSRQELQARVRMSSEKKWFWQ